MPTYELRRGTYRHDGDRLEPGDTVELPAHRVANYASEKFTPVDTDDDGTDQTPDESAEAVDDTPAEPTPERVPEDYHELRKLAVAYDGDEVQGNSPKVFLREFFARLSSDDLAALKADAGLEDPDEVN